MPHDAKKEIRSAMRRRLAALTDAQREAGAGDVFAQIEAMEAFARARTVALYNALPGEIPTAAVIGRWRAEGKRIVLPCVEGGEMIFRNIDDRGMREGCFGIGEPCGQAADPSEIDLMIVPGVAFDRSGHRLGRGKGFYDRFLAQCAAGQNAKSLNTNELGLERHDTAGHYIYKIGVCYPFQLVDSLPREPHDQPVDAVITCDIKQYGGS